MPNGWSELGNDVVLLLDSLTRLGRTFNLYGEGSGRTMSGGLDSGAMKVPRRIFGAARNIENGGSLTIIATALIETGSRMDEVIFEEFKGTGNAEIVLDRQMAHKRIWPAVNLRKSGTRNEELLLGDMIGQHHRLFRALNSRAPIDAMQALLRHLQQFATNEEMLNELVPGPLTKRTPRGRYFDFGRPGFLSGSPVSYVRVFYHRRNKVFFFSDPG